MKAFVVGIVVLLMMGALSVAGILLLPLLLVLGFFLRFLLGVALILFSIWLVGKLTLLLIDSIKKKELEQRKKLPGE